MEHSIALFDPNTTDENVLPAALPPEIEEGNVEYKLKLVNPSVSRFEHLVTQMKWRLAEGEGEAIYEIGVEDSGMLAGLTEEEMTASMETLTRMADKLGASITLLRDRTIEDESTAVCRRAAEVLVRKVPDDQQFIDVRLAVLGNADAGKSTLLGVLTQGELDNGHGRARLNLFRHLHEIQSGRTSSISHEILGFTNNGEVVNYSESRSIEEICENSSKLITMIDLAGHHKYLKTTIFGLTGYAPDFAMLVISANTGIAGTTKEHLGLALAVDVPVFYVISKIDMSRPTYIERTITHLERLLKSPGCNKIPFRVETEDDAMVAATRFNSNEIAPIFQLSSVSGKNINILLKFLNVLPPLHSAKSREHLLQEPALHMVDEVYTVPEVGTVVGGTLVRGCIKEGEKLLAGPTDNGHFKEVFIHSLHRNRLPCRLVQAGQTATLSLGHCPFSIRKGMVLVDRHCEPVSSTCFEASIYLLFHSKSISKGFQTTVHIGNVCQTAILEWMNKECLQTNEKAQVRFRFIKQPEYIVEGSRLLFRDGKTKGMGEVTKIFPYEFDDRQDR
ncbi:GTP-binding protein 2-like [Lingula anatina]|uniref:GTP-binding protein 2-like n=1 Tax=Lingula anatina TaxID=7574 RepID=A0A1S3I1Y0_LINAN|nr:GTP-binding protein 2-like [Lingula anatina]|eukprot:XP_013391354.1 GTP-binding protein 2-like [Lingula anatina]